MAVVLASHSYGKSQVRLTKVTRRPDRHELVEWSVDVQLDGDFVAAYLDGDNSKVIATDTMKNRVYVLAHDQEFTSPEEFAIRYTGDFLNDYLQVEAAAVAIQASSWQRIKVGGRPDPHAFVGGCAGQRICSVTQSRDTLRVEAGISELPILKTTDSAFRDFHRDQFTTLADTSDRIFATLLSAKWTYSTGDHDWNARYEEIKQTLLGTFAEHKSLGVQHTAHEMAAAVLNNRAAVHEIRLSMPNRHRVLFNMAPFERDNPHQVYVTTDEPYGTISATLRRE